MQILQMMMGKMIIWLIVSGGLLTAAFIAYVSYRGASIVMPRRYGKPEVNWSPFADTNRSDDAMHDTFHYVGLGPFGVRLYPRRWASYLIAIGVLLVLLGLFFVLHVPDLRTIMGSPEFNDLMK